MANLTVTVSEQVLLPNNNIETAVNTKVISDVNQVMRRTDTIVTASSGSGQQILAFVDSEAQQVAGSFVRDIVKYIRITNLSSTYSCDIYLVLNDGSNSDGTSSMWHIWWIILERSRSCVPPQIPGQLLGLICSRFSA